MAITPLPDPPSRNDSANFAQKGDDFLAALPRLAEELGALQVDVSAKQGSASAAATGAAASALKARNDQVAAKESASIAESKAVAAQGHANNAGISEQAALAALTDMRNYFYGPRTTDPLTRPDGTPRQSGDRYYSTSDSAEKTFNGAAWYIPNVDGQQLALPSGAAQVGYRGLTVHDNIERLDRKKELIAHRGFRRQAPENTMIAFSTALARGADALETDVQVSSDGVLYCFHDDTVDALTTGSGTFSTLSSAYLDTIEFKAMVGFPMAPVRLSRFTDFLRYSAQQNVRVYPEIKGYRTAADIDLMVQAVIDAGLENMCCLQSFTLADLARVRTLSARLELGKLGSSTSLTTMRNEVNALAALGNASLLWAFQALLDNSSIVEYARVRGVDVGAWTVNSTENARRLRGIGVNKVMSDYALGGL